MFTMGIPGAKLKLCLAVEKNWCRTTYCFLQAVCMDLKAQLLTTAKAHLSKADV